MFKFLIICALSLTGCLAQTPIQVAKNYCKTVNCPQGQSIACQYTTNPNVKCNGTLQNLDNNAIVKFFNSKRNETALGKLPGYKPAVQMATIKWSTELEQMAKYNAMTCKFGHDKCRNTNNFKQSGQNLYYQWGSNLNTNVNVIVQNGLQSWFNEYKDCNMSFINNYHESNKVIGHFTVMVKNDNTFLGCAVNKYPEKAGTTYLLTCNFATTNILDRPIYISGPAASKCPNGTNPQYPGLCKP